MSENCRLTLHDSFLFFVKYYPICLAFYVLLRRYLHDTIKCKSVNYKNHKHVEDCHPARGPGFTIYLCALFNYPYLLPVRTPRRTNETTQLFPVPIYLPLDRMRAEFLFWTDLGPSARNLFINTTNLMPHWSEISMERLRLPLMVPFFVCVRVRVCSLFDFLHVYH